MRKIYERASIKLILCPNIDVLTTSGTGDWQGDSSYFNTDWVSEIK